MTLGFRSILVVNSEKMAICFMCLFFRYASFTDKIENLAETAILKDFFIFAANGHHFQKCQFLIDILSFLKEISSVFESVNFWWRCFLLVKNNIFMQKSSVFGQMSEFLSPVIE